MQSQNVFGKTLGFFLVLLYVAIPVKAQGKLKPLEFMKSASVPSRLFNIPTSDVLQSMEFSFSGGGAFGVEDGGALLRKFIVGLGGIAEVEISTAGITNRLTGEPENLSTSSFKVNLIPERYQSLGYLPNISVQLRSSSWRSLEGKEEKIRAEYTEVSEGQNLVAINLKNRFSTLYLIIGKRWTFGGFQIGLSQTDVRTQKGVRRFYDHAWNKDTWETIPEMKKIFTAPFGGVEIAANNNTRLMAEIQTIPLFDYDVKKRKMKISKAWMGVAGVRFFITEWFSLDTGVKYLSEHLGIADAEIDIGVNIMVPVRGAFQR